MARALVHHTQTHSTWNPLEREKKHATSHLDAYVIFIITFENLRQNCYYSSMQKRWLQSTIEKWKKQKSMRGMIVTGARQVGKTVLAGHVCGDMEYINLDDPLLHSEFEKMGGKEFADSYPKAILDEVQKVPVLFHLVKYGIDTRPQNRYMLLGSAQILLLKKIRESLAGRVIVSELYPLAFCERLPESPVPWVDVTLNRINKSFEPEYPSRKKIRETLSEYGRDWKKHISWGGMPAQLNIKRKEEWREWLRNYVATYLQRDLRDLARINDLSPFRKCEQMIALRTGSILNFSELARDTGISVQTAKNYCSYLELSYQTILLEPFFSNKPKRLIKSPKAYMLDIGIQKVLSGQWDGMTGQQYESVIASELKKIVSMLQPDWNLYHLRTFDGLEVDFLLVKDDMALAIEVKSSDRVHPQDARHLKDLETLIGIPNILKFVIYEGKEIQTLGKGIWGIPAIIFFGPYE